MSMTLGTRSISDENAFCEAYVGKSAARAVSMSVVILCSNAPSKWEGCGRVSASEGCMANPLAAGKWSGEGSLQYRLRDGAGGRSRATRDESLGRSCPETLSHASDRRVDRPDLGRLDLGLLYRRTNRVDRGPPPVLGVLLAPQRLGMFAGVFFARFGQNLTGGINQQTLGGRRPDINAQEDAHGGSFAPMVRPDS